uniref:Uncharacterized protein n=1 Tax=Mus musculus TaxID=10090 RepID=Q3USU7_MOUSE|nr:unnamed protein product [Mus musculus]
MRTWLETDATHWRRSRRTPSSSDTSSAGCEWAWLGRRFLSLTWCPCGFNIDSHPPPNCPHPAVSPSLCSNLSLDIGHHDFVASPSQQKCSATQIWDCHPIPTALQLLRAETLKPIPGDHYNGWPGIPGTPPCHSEDPGPGTHRCSSILGRHGIHSPARRRCNAGTSRRT